VIALADDRFRKGAAITLKGDSQLQGVCPRRTAPIDHDRFELARLLRPSNLESDSRSPQSCLPHSGRAIDRRAERWLLISWSRNCVAASMLNRTEQLKQDGFWSHPADNCSRRWIPTGCCSAAAPTRCAARRSPLAGACLLAIDWAEAGQSIALFLDHLAIRMPRFRWQPRRHPAEPDLRGHETQGFAALAASA